MKGKYFDIVEKVILVILLFATITAIGQEIKKTLVIGEVTLADILLLFIFLEVIGMIKEYYLENRIAISHPIFIAITALVFKLTTHFFCHYFCNCSC